MRVFKDEEGAAWEAVVGRESWGTVVAIFVKKGASEPPREALLDVSSWEDGNRLLLGMSETEVRALLDASVLKPME